MAQGAHGDLKMVCKKCRKEIPDISVYCMFCGRKQVNAERIKRRANGTGTVYKESGARAKPWRALLVDGKKRVSIGYYETQTEALKALAAYEPNGSVVKQDMTVRAVYEAWGAVKKESISESAWVTYTSAWKRMERIADLNIAAVKTADYQAILDGMKKSVSRSSCEKFRNLASQLCQWAMQNDLIDKNYADFLVLPENKKPDEREYFTEEEIASLWTESDRFPSQVTLMMIYTGMRINELFSLKPSDVHLDEEVAPGRYVSYVVGGEKTDAGRNRIIVLHSRILPFVREWMADPSRVYLVERNGSHRMVDDTNFRNRDYYPMLDALGINRISPHKARHTFASRGAKAGVSPTVMQSLMGHEKYETTANYYTHVDIGQLADGIEMIDK